MGQPQPEQPDDGAATQPVCALESRVRLSESMLWDLQRRFFSESATAAWTRGGVPWWVTTNASMGLAYARVALAYLQDCLADGLLPRKRPLHVVELGAGHGRLTHFVFLRLQELMAAAGIPAHRLRYVFTDVAERNLEFFMSHPRFRPHIEAGTMDCALFDAEDPGDLQLRCSGETLSAADGGHPLVAIANYVIDSIRMDVFRIEDGRLSEGLLTLASQQEEPDRTDPALLQRIGAQYDYEPVAEDRYADPVMGEILGDYGKRLGNTTITFPTAGFATLRQLERISGGHFLALVADKGYASEQELLFSSEPLPVVHGSFSLSVNFHALGLWAQRRGGLALHTSPRDAALRISGLLLGPGAHRSVVSAFAQHIDGFGPLDAYALHEQAIDSKEPQSLASLLALVRLGDYDPRLLLFLSDKIGAHCAELAPIFKKSVRQMIFAVWDRFLPWPEDPHDVPFALGRLLSIMHLHDDALRFYEHSLEHFGEHPATYFNLALSAHELRDLAGAERYLAEALALDPGYSPARNLRLRLEEELGRPLATSEAERLSDVRERRPAGPAPAPDETSHRTAPSLEPAA